MSNAYSGWSVGDVHAIAAADSSDQATAFESVLWFGGLVVVLMLSALVIAYLRKWFARPDRVPGIGLTLEDLRRQRDRGRLTIAEYETLKAALLEAMQGEESGDSSAPSGNLFQRAGRS